MNNKVAVRSSKFGKGLFAQRPVKAGELICFVNGKYVTYQENALLEHGGTYSIQIDTSAYLDPSPPTRFLNHSCQPNAGVTGDLRLIAIKDIQPGDEICFDYSTCMLEREWTLACDCNAPKCRGEIADFDQLPASLQKYYIDLGVVQDFILRELFGSEHRAVA